MLWLGGQGWNSTGPDPSDYSPRICWVRSWQELSRWLFGCLMHLTWKPARWWPLLGSHQTVQQLVKVVGAELLSGDWASSHSVTRGFCSRKDAARSISLRPSEIPCKLPKLCHDFWVFFNSRKKQMPLPIQRSWGHPRLFNRYNLCQCSRPANVGVLTGQVTVLLPDPTPGPPRQRKSECHIKIRTSAIMR